MFAAVLRNLDLRKEDKMLKMAEGQKRTCEQQPCGSPAQ